MLLLTSTKILNTRLGLVVHAYCGSNFIAPAYSYIHKGFCINIQACLFFFSFSPLLEFSHLIAFFSKYSLYLSYFFSPLFNPNCPSWYIQMTDLAFINAFNESILDNEVGACPIQLLQYDAATLHLSAQNISAYSFLKNQKRLYRELKPQTREIYQQHVVLTPENVLTYAITPNDKSVITNAMDPSSIFGLLSHSSSSRTGPITSSSIHITSYDLVSSYTESSPFQYALVFSKKLPSRKRSPSLRNSHVRSSSSGDETAIHSTFNVQRKRFSQVSFNNQQPGNRSSVISTTSSINSISSHSSPTPRLDSVIKTLPHRIPWLKHHPSEVQSIVVLFNNKKKRKVWKQCLKEVFGIRVLNLNRAIYKNATEPLEPLEDSLPTPFALPSHGKAHIQDGYQFAGYNHSAYHQGPASYSSHYYHDTQRPIIIKSSALSSDEEYPTYQDAYYRPPHHIRQQSAHEFLPHHYPEILGMGIHMGKDQQNIRYSYHPEVYHRQLQRHQRSRSSVEDIDFSRENDWSKSVKPLNIRKNSHYDGRRTVSSPTYVQKSPQRNAHQQSSSTSSSNSDVSTFYSPAKMVRRYASMPLPIVEKYKSIPVDQLDSDVTIDTSSNDSNEFNYLSPQTTPPSLSTSPVSSFSSSPAHSPASSPSRGHRKVHTLYDDEISSPPSDLGASFVPPRSSSLDQSKRIFQIGAEKRFNKLNKKLNSRTSRILMSDEIGTKLREEAEKDAAKKQRLSKPIDIPLSKPGLQLKLAAPLVIQENKQSIRSPVNASPKNIGMSPRDLFEQELAQLTLARERLTSKPVAGSTRRRKSTSSIEEFDDDEVDMINKIIASSSFNLSTPSSISPPVLNSIPRKLPSIKDYANVMMNGLEKSSSFNPVNIGDDKDYLLSLPKWHVLSPPTSPQPPKFGLPEIPEKLEPSPIRA